MTAHLKPYLAMKDSGVEWLGKVPEHWSTRPLKHWVAINAEVLPETTDPDSIFQYVDIGSVGTGILTKKPPRLSFAGAPSRARRIVNNGDTLVSTVRTYLKAIYFVHGEADVLVCSTGFAVLTPRVDTVPQFVSYIARSNAFTDRATANSVGIAYPAIAESRLGSFHVAIPPVHEQAAIVRYLNHVDRRIQRYIRAKQKLIALLEEQKQAVIHEAVTGQIDVRTGRPYPAYRYSGVEWLGDVPAHWEVRRLGRIGRFFKGGGGTKEDEQEAGVSCVRYGDLYTHHQFFITASRAYVPSELATTVYTPIRYGDVLFAGSGETIDEIGKSAVNLIRDSVCCGGDVIVLRPLIDAGARFLGYAADCPASARQKASIGRGFTVMHVYSSDLKYIAIPLPLLNEQAAIVRFLDKTTADIDSAIDGIRRQIEAFREYHARLIADVVTGKLDVRKAAARLPCGDDEKADERPPGRLHE